MELSQIISGGVFAATALAAVLAYFKYKPGQKESLDLTIAQATMKVTHGSFQLVTTELEEQFKRMSEDMKSLRNELDELRGELSEEKAEKDAVKRENGRLTERVKSLEDEVARLKASQS